VTPHPASSSPEAASLDEPKTLHPRPFESVRTPPSRSRLAWLAFAAVCLFWGTSGPLICLTLRYVAPLWLVTIRFFIAGGLLWVLLWLFGRKPPLRGLWKLVPSGIALAISNVLVTFGFQRVQAGAGTLLLATTAVTFAVVDVCWPGGTSKPTPSVWLGLALGLLGVAILLISPESFNGAAWQGYLMLELSAWIWAVGGVAQARHPSGMDPLQNSA
jgi:drug/metabolite transporter (DMT)-like permease